MTVASTLTHIAETKTITDLVNLYGSRDLNLNPGFQRQSVWSKHDRVKLIDSMLRNYPLPAIFLYRRENNGHIFYDVIDGKQRLESIFMFMGRKSGKFSYKGILPNDSERSLISWSVLGKRQLQHLITGYKLTAIEVNGDLGDIIDVFIRINSTGKALSAQEKRHARYFNSPVLRLIGKGAEQHLNYFRDRRVLSSTQISRMKHVELFAELALSLHQGSVIHKKTALDKVMSTSGITVNDAKRAVDDTAATLKVLNKMFPQLRTTRFSQLADFYSLVVMIGRLRREGAVLSDQRRNRIAWDLLRRFGAQVDEIREKGKKLQPLGEVEKDCRDYLLTVLEGTDTLTNRQNRDKILTSLLASMFSKKDSKRTFTVEQRRIIWNSSKEKLCTRCHKVLRWSDFTVDHIFPHSKGGKTAFFNAALMCHSCNSSKGAKLHHK